MSAEPVVLVAAVALNGVIGAEGDIPWHLPEDLRRFKALTMGGALIMGRKTFDAIGRPLPGRQTIVVTRDPSWQADGVTTAGSVEHALGSVEQERAPYVVGGGEIYRLAMPLADRLEITEVHRSPEGDATFPTIRAADWVEVFRETHDAYSYVAYERRRDTVEA